MHATLHFAWLKESGQQMPWILGRRAIFASWRGRFRPSPRLLFTPLLTGRRLSSTAVPISPLQAKKEEFLSGTSATYIDEMWAAWTRDPGSVHASWAAFF